MTEASARPEWTLEALLTAVAAWAMIRELPDDGRTRG